MIVLIKMYIIGWKNVVPRSYRSESKKDMRRGWGNMEWWGKFG
jgi:hypothetical protein